MKKVEQLLVMAVLSILASTVFNGCGFVRDAAATSYHIATAPVNAIRHHGDRPKPGTRSVTTTTTTVTRSTRTVVPLNATPTHPATPPGSSHPSRHVVGANSSSSSTRSRPSASERVHSETASTKTATKSSKPQAASTQIELPTAKPVADKPGYVLSPFDPKGRYVDVRGYTPGSKVKDPWTDKIFIVP